VKRGDETRRDERFRGKGRGGGRGRGRGRASHDQERGSDSNGVAGLLFPHLRVRGLGSSGYGAARFEFAPISARLATSSFACMDGA